MAMGARNCELASDRYHSRTPATAAVYVRSTAYQGYDSALPVCAVLVYIFPEFHVHAAGVTLDALANCARWQTGGRARTVKRVAAFGQKGEQFAACGLRARLRRSHDTHHRVAADSAGERWGVVRDVRHAGVGEKGGREWVRSAEHEQRTHLHEAAEVGGGTGHLHRDVAAEARRGERERRRAAAYDTVQRRARRPRDEHVCRARGGERQAGGHEHAEWRQANEVRVDAVEQLHPRDGGVVREVQRVPRVEVWAAI